MPDVWVRSGAAEKPDAASSTESVKHTDGGADAASNDSDDDDAGARGKPDASTEPTSDPCETDNGGCGDPHYVRCSSTSGKSPTCNDIDECKQNNGGCGDPLRMQCINQRGKVPECRDIDECQLNNGYCGDKKFWRCTNHRNASPSCADIDECETNNGNCGDPKFWHCANNRESTPTCSDIDECQVDNGGCSMSPKAICGNRPDALPTCVCPYGGPGDGVTCTRFTHDDNSVIDYSTGLMWLRNVDTNTFTQVEANQHCAQISGSGWRLPTKDELISLQDPQFKPAATIDPTEFPNTPAGQYWSSSTGPPGPTWFIYVDFMTGGWGETKDDADFKLYVRCVRTLSCFGETCL